jgi:hypothetical protein
MVSSASSRSARRRRYTDNELPKRQSLLTRHVLNAVTNQLSSPPARTNRDLGIDPVVPDSTDLQGPRTSFKPREESRPLDIPVPYPIVVSSDVPRITNTPTPPPQTHADNIPSLYAMQDPIGALESPPRPLHPFPSVAAGAALTAPGVVGEAAREMLVDSLAAGMDPNVALYVSRLVARRMRNAISVGDDPNEALSQIVGTNAGRNDTINRALDFLRNPDLLPEEAEKVSIGWRPAQIFLTNVSRNNFALLILNQPIRNTHILRSLWQKG